MDCFEEAKEDLTKRICALEGEVSRNTDCEDRGRIVAVLFDLLTELVRDGQFGRTRRYLTNVRAAAFTKKRMGRANAD